MVKRAEGVEGNAAEAGDPGQVGEGSGLVPSRVHPRDSERHVQAQHESLVRGEAAFGRSDVAARGDRQVSLGAGILVVTAGTARKGGLVAGGVDQVEGGRSRHHEAAVRAGAADIECALDRLPGLPGGRGGRRRDDRRQRDPGTDRRGRQRGQLVFQLRC